MDKNLVWAVALSSLFLMGWFHFFAPKPKVQKPAPEIQVAAREKAGEAYAKAEPEKEEIRDSGPAVEKTLDLPMARIVLSSRGAAVKHWWIKEGSSQAHWPDLVNRNAQTGSGSGPFALSHFPNINFKEIPQDGPSGPVLSAWKAVLPNGAVVTKKYFLDEQSEESTGKSYFVNLAVSLENPSKNPLEMDRLQLSWPGGLGTVESEQKENISVSRALAYPSPTKEVVSFKTGDHKNDFSWVALDNRYYLVAFLADKGQFGHINAEKEKESVAEVNLATDRISLPPKSRLNYNVKIYAGPKGYTHLKKWGLGLEHAVDFGFFGFLGKWALKAMYGLHGFFGNYGWSIVALTFLLQILLLPLSVKSYKSMAAMKKLQPKIQDLQTRYKSDPQRLNQEMLSLYKQSGTNPFGGCLPMLLQAPVFWAFFTMLRNSYELRGASWMFWIRDLSQHDPYYVLPLVMGGGMFLQQKISGTVSDPTQAKIMMFMPVIFTFMFLKFPSGLVLYWLTNSVLTIATQYYFSKKYA